MAVPKRKMSRSNTRHRRSNWKAAPVALTTCPQCQAPFLLEKVTKRHGAQLICNTEGCGYVEDVEAVDEATA